MVTGRLPGADSALAKKHKLGATKWKMTSFFVVTGTVVQSAKSIQTPYIFIMLTTELTGRALDWHVARAMGFSPSLVDGHRVPTVQVADKDYFGQWAAVIWMPSSTWHQGGPIIEQEKLNVLYMGDGVNEHYWRAEAVGGFTFAEGLTPLIAAMRCFVVSKFGEEVEVPNGL